MRKLTRTEVDEILLAATILGTGGGGSLDEGMKLMDEIFSQGKDLILADYDEVPEDALIGSPYMCGAISPLTEEEIAKYKDLPVMEDDFCVIAARSMEEFIGKKFAGFNSVEFGGGNTAVAMYVAATAGVPIMNCDAAGRAVPDLQLSTYNIHGINIAPVAVANEFGDQAIFTHLVNDYRAEDMVRELAVVSKNAIGGEDHINTAGVLKDAGTVVSHGNETYINTSGNSGMATAGSGDVLAGIFVGLAAQGMDLFEAAKLAVFLHGRAGDPAALRYGKRSMTSADLIDGLVFILAGSEDKVM